MNKRKALSVFLSLVVLISSLTLFSSTPVYAAKAPSRVTISSVKASKNTITVKIKKVKTAKKYQISYKINSNKKWKNKNTTKLTYSIKNLRYGAKYQVRVRAYNGKWGKWSKTKTVSTPSKVKITSISSIDQTPRTTSELTDNYNNKYSYAVINNHGYNGSAGPLKYEYLLNGKYKKFSGTLYVPKGEKSNRTSALIVKGDGHVLYTSPSINKKSYALKFSVNTTGVKDLIIEWTNNSGYSNISDLRCCLANGYFYYANTDDKAINIKSKPVDLTDLTSIYSNPRVSTRLKDNAGNTYNTAIYNRIDNSHGNKVPIYEYLLNSKYKKLSGVIYIPEGLTFTNSVTMYVIADGNTIYTSPSMTKSSMPAEFNIDVSNCNDVKITFSNGSWYDGISDSTMCIAYAYLYY